MIRHDLSTLLDILPVAELGRADDVVLDLKSRHVSGIDEGGQVPRHVSGRCHISAQSQRQQNHSNLLKTA